MPRTAILIVLLSQAFAQATVDGAATQTGVTRPSDSVILASLNALKSEAADLKSVVKIIKDALNYDVDVGGDEQLMQELSQLQDEAGNLLVHAATVKNHAKDAIRQLQNGAPSYSTILRSILDLKSEAGVFQIQATTTKDAIFALINQMKTQGNPGHALNGLLQIQVEADQMLSQEATVQKHAEDIIRQLQGQSPLAG
ncbi:uncharacterized protein [Haliotis cracherodii]|uniref:uncharacterized protein n=1 Tax=Haliotis cracherodii TaxID=6455 RepID=UPI0039E7DD8D